MNIRLPALLMTAFAMLTAIGCEHPDLSRPPAVRLGRDECAECGMLINDDRFAAAMLTEREGVRDYLLFDDVGCMLELQMSVDSHRTIIAQFVQDHDTRTWIKAETAAYLRTATDRMPTPMGSGLAAFAGKAAAEAAQAQFGGEILNRSQLQESESGDVNNFLEPIEPINDHAITSGDERVGDAYYLDSCAMCGHALGARGETVSSVYEHRDLRFCCTTCQARFDADVLSGLKRIDDIMIEDQRDYYPLTISIVSGQLLDQAPIDFICGNRLFRVTIQAEKDRVLEQPSVYLPKLDKAVVTAQEPTYPIPRLCPVQGEILDNDTPIDIVVANRMIRVCCTRCVRVVKSRPSQYLAMVDYANRHQRDHLEANTELNP